MKNHTNKTIKTTNMKQVNPKKNMKTKTGLRAGLAWGVVAALGCAAEAVCAALPPLDLNGSWDFRFAEGQSIEAAADPGFAATDTMCVPGCYDAMPKWRMRRGTGLYRRTFTLAEPVANAWLTVDGIGLRGDFRLDGRELGVYPYPYGRLEIPTGPLAAGTHTLFAALDNRLDWDTMKLARTFYDFYFYGGFYRGVSLAFDSRRLFVRTRDYRTGTVEVEAVNFAERDFDATLVFDATNAVAATFRDARATVKVPAFRLWSPDAPNLHTVSVSGLSARFGIRTVEARARRLWLNGQEIFLKGVNRHEQCPEGGATTSESQMVRDIQILKSLNANFVRGAHYQQAPRFLDLCDEYGLLVWEESLGWGNGQRYTKEGTIEELKDPDFVAQQVRQTREMVRTSFNHPSVVIFSFLNECGSDRPECKALVDTLIDTIRAEDSGRLVTFACNVIDTDICNERTDLVAINAYPGTIPMNPGDAAELRRQVFARFDSAAKRFRDLYPDKPIMVSESGCGAFYGRHDPYASNGSEEFQDEYLTDILDALWGNPDYVGYSIWQFAETQTHHRNCGRKAGRMLGMSIAGIVDEQRRPKKACETVKRYFSQK